MGRQQDATLPPTVPETLVLLEKGISIKHRPFRNTYYFIFKNKIMHIYFICIATPQDTLGFQ